MYGEKWVDVAGNLGKQLQLDKNNGITYVQIIPAKGKTKDDSTYCLIIGLRQHSMMLTLLLN